MKKYSVLMSVYYKEKPEWLRESITSMLNQTVKPSEIVIVKDGQLPEQLDDVINTFEKKYKELFKIIPLKKNVGLGPALSIGVENCTYEYIARMDSDDISDLTRCEKQLKCFELDEDLEIVGCFEAEFENDIDKTICIHKVPESNLEINTFMKRRCALLHPTVIYKKESVIKSGNYHDVRLYEDYDLFMRMVLEYGCKAYNIQDSLYYMRINSDFYKRRGGVKYLKTVVKFKHNQYKKGYMSGADFVISAGSQAVVCLMPNGLRKWFYITFLRR
jgi:glycosyltransferase involved in cell wall biosynthesis